MSSRSTAAKLTLLGALYFSQGVPYGFFTQALPVMMREAGQTLEQIGFASLLALPWALKFLWAPWVDRIGSPGFGMRKSWIVPLQLATAAVLLVAGALEPNGQFMWLFAIVLIVNALSATQDIATDGLAVEILDQNERGIANGIQVAGYRFGMVVGGGVLLIAFSSLGWRLTFLLMAATIAVATIPSWLHRERMQHRKVKSGSVDDSRHFLRLPGVSQLLVMLFVFKFGETMATTMLRPYLVDLGLGLDEVGWMVGTIGFVAGLLGALAGGWLAGRLRRRTALVLCAAVQAGMLATYVILAMTEPGKSAITWVIAAEHLGGGMATAALFTCMMDWCRTGQSGSDYTVQASTVVIASSLAAALSGITAQHLGYVGHYSLAFLLSLLAIGAVLILFPERDALRNAHPRERRCVASARPGVHRSLSPP